MFLQAHHPDVEIILELAALDEIAQMIRRCVLNSRPMCKFTFRTVAGRSPSFLINNVQEVAAKNGAIQVHIALFRISGMIVRPPTRL